MSSVEAYMQENVTKAQSFSRDFFVSFKDPKSLWTEHWFALALEISCAIILLQIFRHARKTSQHLIYLLLAAACSTTCFEILRVFPHPGYQLWWYHQGFVNVLNQKLPSYVITVFTFIYYMAYSLTNKSNLPPFTRSVATAIVGILIIFPSLWLAQRLLLLTFHFDDPVFKHHIVGVPYIHILVIFLLFFHTTHLFHQNFISIEAHDRNIFSFLKCSVMTGLVSAIYSLIEQYLLYILFNLTMKLNTAVCLLVAVLALLYMARDELKEMHITSYSLEGIFSPLVRKEWLLIAAALLFTSSLPLWLDTQDLKSTSSRLELGPCGIPQEVGNTSPLRIIRRRYLCPSDVPQLEFDFHCIGRKELLQAVKDKADQYTVCGKAFENPSQTFQILFAYSIVCLVIFYAVALFSFTFNVQEKKLEHCNEKVE